MTPLLTLVLGAVLGYCSGWLKSHVDERRKRRAISTALLIEQERALETLRWLRDRWRGGRAVAAFPTMMHDHFTSDVGLFDGDTVARVMEFSGMIAEVRRGVEHVVTSTVTGERDRHLAQLKLMCEEALKLADAETHALFASGASRMTTPLLTALHEGDDLEESL
ncbi:MAG: hypothetical protein ABJD07_04855 [Gemmatimonadaceae bacterium]